MKQILIDTLTREPPSLHNTKDKKFSRVCFHHDLFNLIR
jgi:hypothetical protein